jgi:hypothetical protein
VRRSHEDFVHFVKQPRYYAAVDEIREAHSDPMGNARYAGRYNGTGNPDRADKGAQWVSAHPLGKLPGSVWSIPSEPLTVPAGLGVDHFAAFPTEWPRRLILGWSPPGICTACGQGRRPVVDKQGPDPELLARRGYSKHKWSEVGPRGRLNSYNINSTESSLSTTTITGYACACTPYTDHPGSGGNRPTEHARSVVLGNAVRDNPGGGYGNTERTGPVREYHFDQWTSASTRPAVVLDPFGGTGTTALVAHALGRVGITVDMSADYSRLAAWRTTDRGELAKAMRVPKPAPVPDGQLTFEVTG